MIQLKMADLWFQQDGAPNHTTQKTKQIVSAVSYIVLVTFLLSRSCDITPQDYFLWGNTKRNVYGKIFSMKKAIRQLINDSIVQEIDGEFYNMVTCLQDYWKVMFI